MLLHGLPRGWHQMVNTAKKGTGIEAKAKEHLEKQGYLVHRTVRNPIFAPNKGFVGSHNNDVFGVFDLVAAHPERPLKLVQVTVGSEVAARINKVNTVVERFPDSVEIEVWGWVGGGKRLDRRFKTKKVFIRRQFFKKIRWCCYVDEEFGSSWIDMTPKEDGWIDGSPPEDA